MFKCNLCNRYCNVDRSINIGYCRIDDKLYISSIFLHKGEEPIIGGENGVCNIFFDHCNLQCKFCQNYQISNNMTNIKQNVITIEQTYDKIAKILDEGCNTIGLVSPTPYIPQILELIELLHKNNRYPYLVYNTNGYDTVETIKNLDGIIDIYLPDYKYGSYELAKTLSGAKDYPDKALDAISEMYKQKGHNLDIDKNGVLKSGLIIRHLVLPCFTENSKSAFINIFNEISNKVFVSLMSQYNPQFNFSKINELDNKVTAEEYNDVVNFVYSLGFENGWIQDFESTDYYNPNFTEEEVFKNN